MNLAAHIAPGREVAIREGETELHQRVRVVVPVGDESSRQSELRIALDSTRWPIGSALQVGLPSAAPREVIAVPRDAVVLRPNETFVVRGGELLMPGQRVRIEDATRGASAVAAVP